MMDHTEAARPSSRLRLPFTSRRHESTATPSARPPSPSARPQGLLALPRELRQRILELALGGHLIHVDIEEEQPTSLFSREHWRQRRRRRRNANAPGTLRRYHCAVTHPDIDSTWLHYCWAPLAPSRPPDPPLSLLAPALTCRGLREDALAALYAANTLDFKAASTLAALPRYLPPASVARVRAVRLLLALPELPSRRPELRALYEQQWAAVRALPGLRHLSVLLALPACDGALWRENEDFFLRPVREVAPLLRRCEFAMPTARAELSPAVDVAGCVMRGADEVAFLSYLIT